MHGPHRNFLNSLKDFNSKNKQIPPAFALKFVLYIHEMKINFL